MSQWIDDPLDDEANDELARGPFAGLISKALLAENKRRATVIGLTGGWGSGKSTVANFVLQRVKAENASIAIVQFEPWMVNTSEALAREFFKELGKAVLPRDDSKESKEKRTRFYKYAAQALDALAMTSEAAHTFDVPFSGIASKALKGGKKAMELAAKGLEAQSYQPTLRESREAICKALADLRHPVLVVIDDIDRLNHDEVRTVFQIIKACADFPNIRYLLLYDRNQVEHALEGYVQDKSAFLEKIVSQTFDLPIATSTQREKLIEASIEALGFGDIEGKPLERLQTLYDSVLLPGLSTVRKLKRFFSTASSLIPGVIVDGYRNVDPADFLALEFLRQFAPDFYEVLRNEQEPQPGGRVFRLAFRDEYEKAIKERQGEAIKDITESRLQSLCRQANAILESDISNGSSSHRVWSAVEHSERRFASPHYRAVYLGFQAGRASINEQEWQQFLKSLNPDQSLVWFLTELDDSEQREKWVQIITDRTREIPKKSLGIVITEILRWAEKQPRTSEGALSGRMDWTSAGYLVISACLVQLRKSGEAVSTLKDSITESNSVVASSYFVGMQNDALQKNRYCDWCEKDDLEELALTLKAKMQSAMDSGAIWDLPDPYHAVIAWSYLIGDEGYQKWHQSLPKDESSLIHYLDDFLGSAHGLIEDKNWYVEPKTAMLEAIKNVDNAKLSEAGKWAKANYVRCAAKQSRRLEHNFEEEDGDK